MSTEDASATGTVDVGDAPAVLIVGRGCRLPGAPDPDAFWRVLADGRCTIGEIGVDRWAKARHFASRPGEVGKSYTFAAGVLDDVWAFDPAPFGISPREAREMDPQQRLLLEVVWETLADAGVPPSALAGRKIGVYVGVSSPDSSTRRAADVGATDPYLMTGNTLSLVANRLSYVFDWKGPSLAVDTACSSGLVAFAQAVDAIRAGRIETAVVAAVNVLLSPFPFIGFSAARMLSPEGLCRPFDADGQGYVRAEGAVAFLVTRSGSHVARRAPHYAKVLAVGVNSDGRTSGVSLPSAEAQAALLADVYTGARIDPASLAFIEAHGTGTRVGDPAEAEAIGTVLGRARTAPLSIGSVKGNIGHLEPAAGLAGILKSTLAFEHRLLPASLNCRRLNPAIPFDALNIAVARAPYALADGEPLRAGVSAFGFGGTNAHVVLEAARGRRAPRAIPEPPEASNVVTLRAPETRPYPGPLLLSAHGEDALTATADAWRARLAAGDDRRATLDALCAAVVDRRDALPDRLAVVAETPRQAADALACVATAKPHPRIVRARAIGRDATVAFVYAGNGSQWAGMARAAYAANDVFRARFDQLAAAYAGHTGIDLAAELHAEDLAARLPAAALAQPLVFAIQAALTDALVETGLRPDIVVGHSVGEVAAAYAAGILDADAALRVIHARSASQEAARGRGGMIALAVAADDVPALIAQSGVAGLELAAINAPRGVTLSGPHAAIATFARVATRLGLTHKVLDLDYPFHASLLDDTRTPLLRALDGLQPSAGRMRFVSSVFASAVPGEALDADYWWQNVRAPVRFDAAVAAVADAGAQVFVEIGPRPILSAYVKASLDGRERASAVVASLTREDDEAVDPIRLALSRAIVHGARVDRARAWGEDAGDDRLPAYPWQRRHYDITPSSEASSAIRPDALLHPLLGWPERSGELTWYQHLDATTWPALADHVVGDEAIMPGAALCETALAAARQALGGTRAEVYDFDILSPLPLPVDHMREVRTRVSVETQAIEIASRRRLSQEDWQLHVRARYTQAPPVQPALQPAVQPPGATPGALDLADLSFDGATVAAFYERARVAGLAYGPAFRRLDAIAHAKSGVVVVRVEEAPVAGHADLLIDPIALDVAFHGLLAVVMSRARPNGTVGDAGDGTGDADTDSERLRAFIPVRFGRVVLHDAGRPVRYATIDRIRRGERQLVCALSLYDRAGALVARIEGARFQDTDLVDAPRLADMAVTLTLERLPGAGDAAGDAAGEPRTGDAASTLAMAGSSDASASDDPQTAASAHEARLLIEALARRIAVDAIRALAGADTIDADTRASSGPKPGSPAQRLDELWRAVAPVGLATRAADGWHLTEAAGDLPDADVLLATILAEHPTWWPDVTLLSRAAELWRGDAPGLFTPSMSAAYRDASPRHCAEADAILAALDDALRARDRREDAPPLRVLMLGHDRGGLFAALAARATSPLRMRLTLLADDDTCASVRPALPETSAVDVVPRVPGAMERAGRAAGAPFDVVVVIGAGDVDRLAGDLAAVAPHVRSGAALWATVAQPGVCEAVLAVGTGHDGNPPSRPVSQTHSGQAADRLAAAGCRDVALVALDASGARYVAARFASTAPIAPAITSPAIATPVLILTEDDGAPAAFAACLADACASGARDARIAPVTSAAALSLAREAGDGTGSDMPATDVVLAFGRCGHDTAVAARSCSVLAGRLDLLARLIDTFGAPGTRFWLVLPGGIRASVGRGAGDAVAAGLWAAARTAANENPEIAMHCIDIADGVTLLDAARRLAGLLAAPPRDGEIVIASDGVDAVRAVPLPTTVDTSPDDHALRLERTRRRTGDRVAWQRTPRREPAAGEIEVAVTATGLNFRDAMWSLGLLPEEALEDGFAGPTLGLECAGHIVRVGSGITGMAVGQAVLAFAPNAFATHVTVAEDAVVALPDTIDPAAAATLPVAFLTAYYALHHLAHLEAGETVLIHGGAGGVGLAALQVAQWRSARVIATAGTPEKRALLAALGADHVLDSRSLAFAGDVRALTGGEGVDVVLNALAGEAMEKSLALVKPFGRFLELGKRDFYGHTAIGLRPFRRNVSYFGIDADQLLAARPALARRLLAEVMALVSQGTFTPLPYRTFQGRDVAGAFRLIQQSGHIGKILVVPPPVDAVDLPDLDRVRDRDLARASWHSAGDGAYVVVGGTGGFGLATARWLAARGVPTIVLVSRSGRIMPGAEATFAALQATGVDVRFARADVTDAEALGAVLASVRADMPIRGVVHAAMTLDDAMLSDLTAARAAAVIAPKLEGARHLDQLTRSDDLEVFALYGSVTALIGNPGQAAYVAANAALGTIAEARRTAGRPALAVAWGGITDVGVLAREAAVSRAIARRMGGATFTSDVALAALGELLAMGEAAPAEVTVAPMAWRALRDQLPLIARPMFLPLVGAAPALGAAGAATRSLAEEIRGLGHDEARARIAQSLAEEVARILRLPTATVAADRALSDFGMDSLMGLELRLAVQQRLGVDVPLAAMAGTLTVSEIAQRIQSAIGAGTETGTGPGDAEAARAAGVADLAMQHLGTGADGLDRARLAPLLDKIDHADRKRGAAS